MKLSVLRAALVAVLVGCTSMPDIKVEGIDNLKIEEYVVADSEIWPLCAPKLGGTLQGILALPLACAIINLDKNVCVIITADNTPPSALEHERLHCKGYWHDDGLRVYRDNWRSNKERDV